MKKERKPLTTREKVLIGVGVVGACVAGYFGYKYFNEVKMTKDQKNTINDLIKDLMSKDTEAETAKKIALEAMDAANNQEVINDITKEALEETMKELEITKDEVEVMKHIICESDIIPNSLQNGSNKISRVQKKIADTMTQIDKYPNDVTLQNALKKHESKLADLLYKHSKTEELGRMMEEDNITYK